MRRLLPRTLTGGVIATLLAVAVVVAVAWFTPLFDSNGTRVVAYFTRSTGLYTGDEVKVLGVKVGTVVAIKPEGTQVRVELDVGDQKIPADAKAAIVAPSLVSGRFVQLAPAYVNGPAMADGASIPKSRTAVPVEFDEIKTQLTQLAKALGPDGVGGPKGSLNSLIVVAEKNLDNGTAADVKTSLTNLSKTAQTLTDNRGDLFATVRNLNSFIQNLVVNDAAVRKFSSQLTTFSNTLADNRTELATAVDSLDQALKLVTTFVKSNTNGLSTTVSSLNSLAQTVAQKDIQLATILQNAPYSADDFYNIIERKAVTGRVSVDNFQGVGNLLCSAILGSGGTSADCQTAIAPLLKLLGLTTLPGVPGVPLAVPAAKAGSASSTPAGGGKTDLLGTATNLLSGTLGTVVQGAGGLTGLLLPGGGK